jgi:DNA helicase-2/ATP-dependent DNA helicase PcrA
MAQHHLLAGCDEQQRTAITTEAAPLCILASAGSGKTRVLTRRIAWQALEKDARPDQVLALTFTRKAASELRRRLGALGLPTSPVAGTFHAIALSELRRRSAETGRPAPVVLASKARLVRAVLDDRRGPRAHQAPETVHEIAGEIEWAKASLIDPDRYAVLAERAHRRTRLGRAEIASVFAGYESERRRRGVLDFEDLLMSCADLLEHEVEFAASARFRFRHIFVDEYQDVNEAQLRLLAAWIGPRKELCVVGDPDQAIYSWNGSDPEAIHRFSTDFPGATVLRLHANYRSTAQVLSVAGALLEGSEPPVASGPVPDGMLPTVVSYDSDDDENWGVVTAARTAHRPGRGWSHIAVLARTNAQLLSMQRTFDAAGIPSRLVGETGFARRPHVVSALNSFLRMEGRTGVLTALADLRSMLEERDPSSGDPDSVPSSQEVEDLVALASLCEDYLATDTVISGAGFKTFVELSQGDDPEANRRDAVDLITFHRAKGLEWPVVFVVGLEDGLVPIAHARTEAARAEERRLLYVACTRAEEELHCSFARARRFSPGRLSAREPSPFLAPIEAARARLAASALPSGEVRRRALAESRRALTSAS